jgi:DNA invertase Pin-like site-specific DNA recombinase
MRLIGYLRVSSDSQVDGYGLAMQEQAIRSWMGREQHIVGRFTVDAGVSGTVDASVRPGLSDAIADIAKGLADGLVVARLDRLARALTVQEATLAVVWRAGGEIFTADAGRILRDDPDDPMRTALRQVLGVFAELDRRMVVKRLRDGRAAKALTGKKSVGPYRFGSTATGTGRNLDAGPNPAELDVLHLILRLRDEGLSYRKIAHLLDEAGHRPRRAEMWSPMTLRNIVSRANMHSEIASSRADRRFAAE